MAAKPKSSNPLSVFISQILRRPRPSDVARSDLGTRTAYAFTNNEKNDILERIGREATPAPRSGVDAYAKYIKPLARHIARVKLDNAAILRLSPELLTAETIVIPSIMSPTDLKDGKITLLSNSTLIDAASNLRVAQVLDTFFNQDQQLSHKIPGWIKESLYGAGAKPLLILPRTELDTIMNDPTAVLGSQESAGAITARKVALANLETIDRVSPYGMADKPLPTQAAKASATPDACRKLLADVALRPALEAAVQATLETFEILQPDDKKPFDVSKQVTELCTGSDKAMLLSNFARSALETISIVDNADIMKVDKLKKTNQQTELTNKARIHYKMAPIITINPETKPPEANPVVYELPPESVIPIYTPGAPEDHIGYFIVLDEYGNPIHVAEEDGPALALNNDRQISAGQLYNAFGFATISGFNDTAGTAHHVRSHLMVGVYQTIIEGHLKGRLKDTGFTNVDIGTPENVYRYMFARYLSLRRTRLLFVPKDFVTYFCFRHNTNGTGRSKLEDIKFILSLKITLMICRMMAAMNNSINRRKVSINFTKEMGDPIRYMEMVKKEAIDKAIVNFSWDPDDITRTLAQRSLTVEAKGLPGAEAFAISQEPNEIRSIMPDTELSDMLANLMILGLDVPPSAMNMLNENEFSRSVATNNLFFSRRISAYQTIVCTLVARYIKIYILHSQELQRQIKAILHQGEPDNPTQPRPDDNGTAPAKPVSVEVLVHDIIQNLTVTLPAPDIAPDKAQFEEFTLMMSSLDTALASVFDDALDGNTDNVMATLRALVKSTMARDYMKRVGLTSDIDFPGFDGNLTEQLIGFKQFLANLKAGVAATAKPPTGAPAPEADGFGGAPDAPTF